MTPAELDALLETLRKHAVQSAEVPTSRGTLRVVFEHQFTEPLPGATPPPGAWKAQGLDAPFVAEEQVP